MREEEYNSITSKIIGAAIEVHKELGPGLLESTYQACLNIEMLRRGLDVKSNLFQPIYFKGEQLDKNYIIDVLVDDEVILELKSVEAILPVHEAQLLTYLKLANKKVGLLINFNVPVLKDGIRRKINGNLNRDGLPLN